MRVNIKILKAAILFAGEEESRYYLKGVYVQPFDGVIHYAATNGHVLVVIREQDPFSVKAPGFILPTSTIKSVKYGKRSDDDAEVRFLDAPNFLLTHDGVTTGGSLVEGSFPDYLRVIPQGRPSGQAGQFNHNYLAAFQKAATLLTDATSPAIIVGHDGPANPARVSFLPDDAAITGFGVIMPVRTGPALANTPSWLTHDRKDIAA